MTIPCDPRLLLHNRVMQCLLYFREYRIIAEQVISIIGENRLTGLDIVEKFHALTQVRESLLSNIAGVENQKIRDSISDQFSIDCESELIKVDGEIELFLAEMHSLIDKVVRDGQVVSISKDHGRVDSLINFDLTHDLKKRANSIKLVIDDYN